jgi:hypothetical protein
MQNESPSGGHFTSAATRSGDLAEGLMLLRASTLKIARLQLAMERHDRRASLQAIDDIVLLDRRLQDSIGSVFADEEHVLVRRQLEADRAMLNLEKLTLGAEVQRRSAPPMIDQQEDQDDSWLGPRDLIVQEAEPSPRRLGWLIAFPILASLLGAGAYFLDSSEVQLWLAAAGLR